MNLLEKFWPILVLIGIGVVALMLINLDKGSDNSGKNKLPAGLKIEDVEVGTGEEAQKGDTVSVTYTGRFADSKKVFDSNDKPGGKPFVLKLGANSVIPGWEAGIPGMKEGGKRRLFIPANLAYGERGHPPAIPPNADLEFDVELLKVEK